MMENALFGHRFLRLINSNSSLIQMYTRYLNIEEDNKWLRNEIIQNRIEIRNSVRKELAELEKNSLASQHLWYRLNSPVIKTEYKLANWTTILNYQNCYKKELSNLNLYYKCIKSHSILKEASDILIAQKNAIEAYLIAEL